MSHYCAADLMSARKSNGNAGAPCAANVIAFNFDEPPGRHVQVAEMVIEKAKPLGRAQKKTWSFLVWIPSPRLARAYNT